MAAYEVLLATPDVAAAVRAEQPDRIREALVMGGRHGMKTLEQYLTDLIERGQVEYEEAVLRAPRPTEVPRPNPLRGKE